MFEKKDRKKELTKEECVSLIRPAINQAKKLRADSKALFEKGRYSTAYSLYVLSFEELGKAFMCIFGAVGTLAVKNKNLYSHIDKQRMMLMNLMLCVLLKWDRLPYLLEGRLIDSNFKPADIVDAPPNIQNEIQELINFLFPADRMKQMGFYVDYEKNGVILDPEIVITKEDFPSMYFRDELIEGSEDQIIQNMGDMLETCRLFYNKEVFKGLFPISVDKFLADCIQPIKKDDKEKKNSGAN